MPKLHIACLRPGGYNRGGVRHEGLQTRELDAFSIAQLRDMFDDPHLALVVGGEALTEERVAAMEAAAKEAAEKLKKAKAAS